MALTLVFSTRSSPCSFVLSMTYSQAPPPPTPPPRTHGHPIVGQIVRGDHPELRALRHGVRHPLDVVRGVTAPGRPNARPHQQVHHFLFGQRMVLGLRRCLAGRGAHVAVASIGDTTPKRFSPFMAHLFSDGSQEDHRPVTGLRPPFRVADSVPSHDRPARSFASSPARGPPHEHQKG